MVRYKDLLARRPRYNPGVGCFPGSGGSRVEERKSVSSVKSSVACRKSMVGGVSWRLIGSR